MIESDPHPPAGDTTEYNKWWRRRDPSRWTAIQERYYSRGTPRANATRPWTTIDDEAVLARGCPDAELADSLGRSIAAVQVRRSKLLRKDRT